MSLIEDDLHERVEKARKFRKGWSHPPTPIPQGASGLWYSEECADEMLAAYAEAENKELLLHNLLGQSGITFPEGTTDIYRVADVLRLFREAESELAQLREQVRWIPVSEKLPRIDEYVIWADTKMGQQFIEAIDKDDERWWGEGTAVTHWRALPAPPSVARPK